MMARIVGPIDVLGASKSSVTDYGVYATDRSFVVLVSVILIGSGRVGTLLRFVVGTAQQITPF